MSESSKGGPTGQEAATFGPTGRPKTGPFERPKRALLATAGLGLGVFVLALFAIHPDRSGLRQIDDAARRYLATDRPAMLTSVADVFSRVVAGRGLLLVRVLASLWLAFRRRWWALAAFVLVFVLSDSTTELMKHALGRPRPQGSLVAVTGFSFPSGQAVATTATAIALVLLLVTPGTGRRVLLVAGLALSAAVAWSRVYLAAHWLSDTVGGIFLGACIAVGVLAGTQAVRDRLGSSAQRE
jgi:membrane-associated phospholipid phosphatase